MSIEAPAHGEHEAITGQYIGVEIDGTEHRVYYEEAGPEDGIPLLCQHTAGNHGHEWRHILADDEITEHFRVIAYDLPHHGKSVPPTSEEWWLEDYTLTEDLFAESIVSIADALELDDPVYMGSSIGGNVILQLGDWHPDRFRALIGLECGTYSPGYYLDWFDDPQVNIAEASAYACWGLMAPHGPEASRRETMHLYEQSSTGLFKGDLFYYSVDHDYRGKLDQVNPECPVYVMNGEYDFATNPDDAREVADGIGENATAIEMSSIGHFPMSENPELFKEYLKPVLDDIRGEDVELAETMTPEAVGYSFEESTAD
ncbi:carboxylesterase [Haloprofundus marisrubri]|uniref:Carboxylesterase n=1 Tax=Haloprofundus marisrubri TaxID=1514971 RepID=A0A0W1RDN4_9EURY|nr:alpha/beta hydrolase [Haloprofundus marisrubri]KTG11548.1 carboxylesterase [Haloprofundus marisrubri]